MPIPPWCFSAIFHRLSPRATVWVRPVETAGSTAAVVWTVPGSPGAAVTGAFARCMPNFPCEPPTPAYFDDVTVYHAQPHGNCDPLYGPIVPKLFVDVGPQMETKAAMLAAHKSQKLWLDQSQGLDSYIMTMNDLMRSVGKLSGGKFEFAEGFRRHLHLGFCAEGADPLAEALADEPALMTLLRSLSRESLHFRFVGIPALTPANVGKLLSPECGQAFSLIAESRGQIVGFAAFHRNAHDPARAEAAFVVADACQGQGIGTRLLESLAAQADDPAGYVQAFQQSGQELALASDILRNRALEAILANASPVDEDGNPVDLSLTVNEVEAEIIEDDDYEMKAEEE